MTDAQTTALIVGLATVLGAAVGATASLLATQWQLEHQRALAADEREADLTRRRGEFQAETLLELQLATQRLARATGSLHYDEVLRTQHGGESWGASRHNPTWSMESHNAGTAVLLLASRVQDEEVRQAVAHFKEATTAQALARSEAESQAQLMAGIDRHQHLLELIGRLVRDLPPPSTRPTVMVAEHIAAQAPDAPGA